MEHPAGGQPLELVRFNTSTSKFEVGQEALAILRTVKGPVGVVAVSGRARQVCLDGGCTPVVLTDSAPKHPYNVQ